MICGRRQPAASHGDSDEFAAAALEFLDALYRSAVRLTRNTDDAQDLVQDTYLKAIRARERFTDGTNLKAWLYTILNNTWRNRRRDHSRARVDFDSQVVEQAADGAKGISAPTVESPENLLQHGTLDADLKIALDRLPESFREAVWLRDVEELTYQEIARVLDVPVGTVMSRISRGRKQLYDALVMQRG
jgi:RNA polymerase sigma-70 factor (ECF subfamily)